jgi:flagellar biosynthetic protein FliR
MQGGGGLEAAVAAPEAFVLGLLWYSLRAGAALALMPAIGGQALPLLVRIGVAGTVGFHVLAGGSAAPVPADLLGLSGLVAAAGELAVGFLLALALHAAFAAASLAGEWIGQAMGLGFAMSVSPATGQVPTLSMLFTLLMWAIFLGAGGHLLLFETIVASYRALPATAALLAPGRLEAILGWGGFAIASGLLAALPLAGALFLANILVAVAAKSAPQLNLFAIGFPLMLLIGLVGLPLALPGIAEALASALLSLQERAAGVLLG